MPKITFDTNIFISRARIGIELPGSFYLSAIVLQELTIGAVDDSQIKILSAIRREYEKAGRLLVPNAEDWWQTGKIINALQRGLKSQQGGQTPKLAAEEKYRLTNDVLIARTAKREGVTIVTDNARDFEMIRRFCAVKIVSSADYFGALASQRVE